MICLRQPPPSWDLPDISPFGVQLQTYLKMVKLQYHVASPGIINASRGSIWFVEIDGKRFSHPWVIRELLKRHGDPLDKILTPEKRELSQTILSQLEEEFYSITCWLRWTDETSWKHVRVVLQKIMPPILSGLFADLYRKKFLLDLETGNPSRSDMIAKGQKLLQNFSIILGNKPFLHGNDPHRVDASLYGFLVQTLYVPWDNPLKEFALSLPNMREYCERIKSTYWY